MEGEVAVDVPNSSQATTVTVDPPTTSPPTKGDSASSRSSHSPSPPRSPKRTNANSVPKRRSFSSSPNRGGSVNISVPSSREEGDVAIVESQPLAESPVRGMSPDGKTPKSAKNKKSSIKIKKQYSKIYRIKTKILQNLGKADKTTDEIFDDYEAKFSTQQINANKLQRDVTNYLRCARALHGASKTLFETIGEVYEDKWVGNDLIYVQAQNSDMLWTDFCHRLQDQTLNPLTAYTQNFPELRKKIDKRGRKLVDYDSQRHQLENLSRAARRDDYKIARAKDQMETARTTYESMNKELYDELPNVHDQRIPRVANCLQTMFAAEGTFMRESSKISHELEAISDKLSKECSRGTYDARRGSPSKQANRTISNQSSDASPQHSPAVRPTISNPTEPARNYEDIEFEERKKLNGTDGPTTNGEVSKQTLPEGATTTGLPSGTLYRVKATYKYVREDVDELGFDIGEVIDVVEYDDPEEQEEGWLCGIKESTTEKGLFPANFTRPI